VKPIILPHGSTFSLNDGGKIKTSLDSSGKWHMHNSGDSKQFFDKLLDGIGQQASDLPSNPELWIRTASLDSTLAANYKIELSDDLSKNIDVDIQNNQWKNREFSRIETDLPESVTSDSQMSEVLSNARSTIEAESTESGPSDLPKSAVRSSTRSTKGFSKKFQDFHLAMGIKVSNATISPTSESLMTILAENTVISTLEHSRRNPTMSQALNGVDKDKWLASKQKEDNRLEEMDTFEELPGTVTEQLQSLPVGVKPLHIWPIFKIKDDGTFKTREVVMGNEEQPFGDQYSPTVSRMVVWLIFAVTVLQKLNTRSLDITGAFLYEKLNRTVYVWWKNRICRLKRSLYGLRDAPKNF